jgi:putative phage-type endonuclease
VSNQEVDQKAAEVKDPCEPLIHSDDREAWLELRDTGIGASESGVILGLSPFSSAYTLFAQRTGLIEKRIPDNRFMEWGRRLEAPVAEWFRDETGRPIARDGWLRRSNIYPWLLATPDYDQSDPDKGRGLLECKTASALKTDEWTDKMPLDYQCQLQHQLVVTGKPWGSLVVLLGGNDPRYGDIDAHARFQAALIRATLIFWKQLQGELPPPEPDAHPSTSQTLMMMVEGGAAVQLPDIALQWHQENVRWAEIESEAKARKEEYRDLLRSVIGRATYGFLPADAGAYTFKTTHRAEKIVPAGQSRTLLYTRKVVTT